MAAGLLWLGPVRELVAVVLAAVPLVSACTRPPEVELDPLNPYGDQEPPPEPWLASANGSYYVQSQVEVDTNAHDTTLRAYVDQPGATLIAAAQLANVTAAATLQATMPAGTYALLPSWYDDAVRGNAVGLLGVWGIAAALQALPNEAVIESELVIDGANVTHRLSAIYFDVDTLGDRFELGGVDGELVDVETTATFEPSTWGGNLALGAHQMVVAYGDYNYQLTNKRDSRTLRGSVGALTMCPLVAVAIANKCNGSCTLLVPAFTELCEQGLDAIFAQTRAQLGNITLRFTGGSAAIVDSDHDGMANTLTGWWSMDPAGISPPQLSFSARPGTVPAP